MLTAEPAVQTAASCSATPANRHQDCKGEYSGHGCNRGRDDDHHEDGDVEKVTDGFPEHQQCDNRQDRQHACRPGITDHGQPLFACVPSGGRPCALAVLFLNLSGEVQKSRVDRCRRFAQAMKPRWPCLVDDSAQHTPTAAALSSTSMALDVQRCRTDLIISFRPSWNSGPGHGRRVDGRFPHQAVGRRAATSTVESLDAIARRGQKPAVDGLALAQCGAATVLGQSPKPGDIFRTGLA